MQIVLNTEETKNVITNGLKALHGFNSPVIDLDVTKQRNGETITTITLGSEENEPTYAEPKVAVLGVEPEVETEEKEVVHEADEDIEKNSIFTGM